MSSEYKTNGTGNPNNGMIDRRIFTVGGLAFLLEACAGPLTRKKISEQYVPHVEQMASKQPDSIKISEVVDQYLMQSKPLPRELETPVYDTKKAQGVLSPEEKDTLDRVVIASTYINTLEQNRGLPHLYMEQLKQINNDENGLEKIFPGYSQQIANDAKDYIARIERQLGNGGTGIRDKVKKLREKIGKLAEGQLKTELKQVMADFDARSEGLQAGLIVLMAAGRNFGYYNVDFYDAYANIEKARTGIDHYKAGEEALAKAGVDVKKMDSSLEEIANGGTKFDMRNYTHPLRKKLTDTFIELNKDENGKLGMTPASYMAGLYRVISAERSNTNPARRESIISPLDFVPIANVIQETAYHISQASGYEGLDATEPQDYTFLLMAILAAAADGEINMDANEHRLLAGFNIISTLGAIAAGWAFSEVAGGKTRSGRSGGSSGSVASQPMGSNPVVQTVTGGRGARTGGAGAGTR